MSSQHSMNENSSLCFSNSPREMYLWIVAVVFSASTYTSKASA